MEDRCSNGRSQSKSSAQFIEKPEQRLWLAKRFFETVRKALGTILTTNVLRLPVEIAPFSRYPDSTLAGNGCSKDGNDRCRQAHPSLREFAVKLPIEASWIALGLVAKAPRDLSITPVLAGSSLRFGTTIPA